MFSACVPLIFCTPAVAITVFNCSSMIGLQTLMVMPSRASTMALKPEKSMMITLVILSPVSSWTALTVHCGPPDRVRVGDLPFGVGADVVLVGQRVGGVVPGLACRGVDVQVTRDRQDGDVLPVRRQMRDHQDVRLHGRIGGCRPADLGVLRADPGVRPHQQDVLRLVRLRGLVRRNRGRPETAPVPVCLIAWSVGS